MTQNVVNNEGTYKLLSMTVSTPERPLDISPYVAKLDIYESILSPSVIAEVIISDATGMFSSFSFTEEEICVSWTTHDAAPPLHYKLKILEVDPVLRAPNDKSISYILTCVSEELIESKTTIDVPLVRQKIEADKIPKIMLKDVLKTEKDISIEKTKGLHTFSFTDLTPFDCINKARMNAISSKHPASAYVFFENAQGYHFKTIEMLIEEGKKKIGDKFFIHSNLAGVDPLGSRWRNIIAFKLIQSGNHNVAAKIGGYSNSAKRLNLIEGDLEYYEKKSEEVNFVTLNDNSISASKEHLNKRSKNQGGKSFAVYNSDQETNQLSEKYNYLPYYLSHFLSVISHMTIYGDSTITVGDVITARIPKMNSLTDQSYVEDDPMTSGNYLVCKVRHVLTFGDKPQYFQGLEVIKDGVGGNQPKTLL